MVFKVNQEINRKVGIMKVSVIVPVYNVYDYLEKCLDSLANQTLKEMEVIIVNDGSPDNSQEIIDKYVKKHKNMHSYQKPNGGLSDARNYGLKYAKGEYIAFLDSDDFVKNDMYEKMYEKAKEKDFDMVVCDINYLYPDKTLMVTSGILSDTKDIKSIYSSIHPAAWNKIFKKELFKNDVYFKCGVWFEDVEFIYRMLPYIKSIGVVHEPFNQYVQREGSITNTINRKIYDYVDNMNGIIDFYKKRKLYQKYEEELEYVYVRYLYATFIKSASRYNKNDYMEAVDTAIKNVNEHFPSYKKNKYFKGLKGLYLKSFNKNIAKIFYKVGRK